jgi:hypothetical protein
MAITTIKIDARAGLKKLKQLGSELSKQQIRNITSMSLNKAITSSKTEAKKSITDLYNLKSSYVDKKLFSLKASKYNLTAQLNADHKPVSLASFPLKFKSITIAYNLNSKKGRSKGNAVKRSVGQVSVQIFKDGPYKTINTAFAPGVVKSRDPGVIQATTPAIFARGKRGKPDFQFGKSRYPIDTLSSVSVATAALNDKNKPRIEKKANEVLTNEFSRLMKNALNKL